MPPWATVAWSSSGPIAAEPGKTASDTGQGSGPYAAALAAELVKPNQSDLIMFHHVRVAVMDKTNGDQVPCGIQRRERVLFGGKAVRPRGCEAPGTGKGSPLCCPSTVINRSASPAISVFLAEQLAPALGGQTDVKVLLHAYRTWCQERGKRAVELAEFVRSIQRSAISLKPGKDGRAYAVDFGLKGNVITAAREKHAATN